MTSPRADLVICGQIVIAAERGGLERAQAIGIADGRVVSAGTRREVTDAAARGARVLDFGPQAVIPGLHDFHIHLPTLARARVALQLDDAIDGAEVVARLRAAAGRGETDAWVTGRGWTEAHMASVPDGGLADAAGERPAYLSSHDGHSAWASPAARSWPG